MAYSSMLATRVRFSLEGIEGIHEKENNGRLFFTLKGKSLIGILENDLTCRIAPLFYDEISSMECCKKADFFSTDKNRHINEKNIVIVSSSALLTKKQLTFWIDHCLLSHPEAPLSHKRKKKPKLEFGSEE